MKIAGSEKDNVQAMDLWVRVVLSHGCDWIAEKGQGKEGPFQSLPTSAPLQGPQSKNLRCEAQGRSLVAWGGADTFWVT